MKSPFKIWRTSLVSRVTGTIVLLSIILIALLGSALYSRVSAGIFDEKLKLSILDAQSTARNTQIQLNYSRNGFLKLRKMKLMILTQSQLPLLIKIINLM